MTARDPAPASPDPAPPAPAAPPRKKRRAALATQPVERIQRSLFGEILDWMLAPLLLLWPMSIAITYLIAQSIANQPFDRALEDSVTVLAQQVSEVNGKVVARLPVSARDLLRADDIDNIYYKVTGPNGEYVEGDVDMPQPPVDDDRATLGTVQFRNDILHGSDVRIATLQVDLRRSAAQRAAQHEPRLATVQVGETLEKRAQLMIGTSSPCRKLPLFCLAMRDFPLAYFRFMLFLACSSRSVLTQSLASGGLAILPVPYLAMVSVVTWICSAVMS